MKLPVIGRAYSLSAIVDSEDYRTLDLGSYKWTRLIGRNTTYVATHKNGKTIYLHRMIMGLLDAPRSDMVDHIDGNGLNNSRTNLRKTNNRGNQANARKRLSTKTSSSYKGVFFDKRRIIRPWRAQITLSEPSGLCSDNKRRGKRKFLGSYRTETEAATAYNKAAIELFGPLTFLNIITP